LETHTHNFVAHFTSHGKLYECGAEKPVSSAKSEHFDFFTLNFTVWNHILCTGGDAVPSGKQSRAQATRYPMFIENATGTIYTFH
jgi:hypothetical protein